MKSWTSLRIIILSLFLGACSRNPLGEDLNQPILNFNFLISQTCTTIINQDSLFSCQMNINGPVPGIVWTLEPASTCAWAVIDATTGIVTGTPNDDQVGVCALSVKATSPQHVSNPYIFSVTTQNLPAIFTIGNASNMIEDAAVAVIRNNAAVQASEEGMGLYSFDHAGTTGTRCIDNAATLAVDANTGAVSFAPALNYNGTCNIRVAFDDGNAASNSIVTAQFSITVTPVNDAPVMAPIANQTTPEDIPRVVNFTITDVDNTLTCASVVATSSNTALIPLGNIVFGGTAPNCTATITPFLNLSGVSNLTFTVSDGSLTAVRAFVFTVTAVDDPPVLAAIPNQSGFEDTPLIYTINITDVDTVLACNNTFLSATSSNAAMLPAGNIVFSGVAPNCTVTMTPLLNTNGVSNIVITLTDGNTPVTQAFTATYAAVNDAPILLNIPNQVTNEDTSLVVNFTITDVDNALNCATSMSRASSNATLIGPANIVFGGTAPNCTATLTPLPNMFGTANITLTVSDGAATDAKVFLFTVNPINDAPFFSTITNQTTAEDTPLIVNFTINDVDNALACNATSLTATSSNGALIPIGNIVFGGVAPNCTATLSPLLNQNGVSTLSFTVTDGLLTDVETFTFTVTAVNDAPVLSAIGNQTTLEDTPVVVNFTMNDVDNVLNCSTSMIVTSSNGTLLPTGNVVFTGAAPNCTATISPAANQFGVSNISFTLTDGSLTDVQNFSFTVTAVNDAPVMSAIANQTTVEDTPLVVNFTITDVDDVLTCAGSVSVTTSNVALLPLGGIVIGGAAPNCTATLSPLLNQNGVSNLSFTVTDGVLTDIRNFTFTVSVVNDAPAISAIANQVTLEDTPLVVNFTITDVDDVLTCAGSVSASTSNGTVLPLGAIVFGGAAPNCTATLTPAANQSGVSNLIFTVTDGVTPVASNFTFTVTAVDDPPVLSVIGNQSTNEDTASVINFTINDVDSVLTCAGSMSATTSNAGLIPVGAIVFSGAAPNCTATLTPVANQFGVSNLSFTVTDGTALTDVQNFSYTVTAVNDPPIISAVANQTTMQDIPLVVNFTISDVDNVLDCTTSMSSTSSNAGLIPTGNIVFGGAAPNCTATLSPVALQSGVSNLSITVTDGTTPVTRNFTFTVTAFNYTPVLSAIANQSTPEDTPLVANFTITDLDDVLDCTTSMSATTSNGALIPLGGVVFGGAAPNCTATLTPALNQNGVSNLSFIVNDGNTTDTQNFTFTVTAVNDAPVLSVIANQTTPEGTAIVVNFTLNDVDNILTCAGAMSATTSNTTVLPLAAIVFGGAAPNCTATMTPAVNQPGVSNISFTATDGSLTDVKNFTFTATVVNDSPILSAVANQTTPEDTALAFGFTITDVDDVLDCTTSMSATTSNAALIPIGGIVFSGVAPNCTATLTSVLNQTGVSNLSFIVTDGNSTDTKNFTFTVTAVNDAPVMGAIANQTTPEDTPIVVNFTINDVDNVLNCGTSVSATTSNGALLPLGGIVFGGAAPNCTATLSPALNQSGVSNLSFTVTDGTLTDVKNFSLTVTAVNDSPVLSVIANQTTSEDTPLGFAFTITDVDDVLDCTTSMSATTSNAGLIPLGGIVFGGAAPNCTVTVSPIANQNGVSNLSFIVTDGNSTDTKNFTFTVTAVNDAPVMSAIGAQLTAEDTPIAVNFTITDIDSILLCTNVNLSVTSTNTGLVPIVNVVWSGAVPNCTASITPVANMNGATDLTFTVMDNGTPNLQDARTFTLTVTAVNDPPVLSAIANQTTPEDTPVVVNFTITDVDNVLDCTTSMSASTSNATVLPLGGIVFGGAAPNCTVTLTPAANQSGISTIGFTVTDSVLTDVKNFTFTVTAVDDPPVLSAIANQSTLEDTPVVVNFTITDVDSVLDCTTSMSASSTNTTILPLLNIVFGGVAPNCTATLTPASNQAGVLTVGFTVTDGTTPVGGSFSLMVTVVNDLLVISVVANQITDEDTPFVINFTINDSDDVLDCLTSVSATSSDGVLLPIGNIVFGGTAPNCTATVTPAANQSGVTNVSFIVSDSAPLTDTTSFSITVNPFDDPPTITPIADVNINEDSSVIVNFTITDPDSPLSCLTSVTATSTDLALLPLNRIVFGGVAPNCTATLTPVANGNGLTDLEFFVTDGNSTVSSTFNLSVNAINDAPTIAAIAAKSTLEDTPFSFNFTIDDVDSPITCGGSVLVTSSNATLLPSGSSFSFSGTVPNCSVTVTPALNRFGSSNINFFVTDGFAVASRSFSITVTAVNDAPVISAIGNQSTNEGTPIAIPFTITDVDNVLACSGAFLSMTSSDPVLIPTGNVAWSGTVPNCTATVTPNGTNFGVANLGFVVTDGLLTATSSFNLTVIDLNFAATITSISDEIIYEGRPNVVSFTLYDSDGPLTCTAANLSATSSNPTLVPVGNIVFGGVYPNCTATVSLAGGQMGTSNVAITVTDTLSTNVANFLVTGHKINSVSLSPTSPIVPKNSNFSFTLTATYSDASTKNITTNSSWATSNAVISSFPSAGVLNNTYAGVTTATTTVTATYGAFSANTVATINPATITSLFVNPTSATLNIGNTLQIRCFGITSDNGVVDLTQSCSWGSANVTIATVDNSLDKGLVTAVNLGSATNITATYSAMSADAAITVDVTAPTQSDIGTGLTAQYFSGGAPYLQTLVNTRIDAGVNFNWANGNNPAGNADFFSVRWTGFIKAPTTGTYTFYVNSDDGSRLWVNGVQITNDWSDHALNETSGTILLTAGTKYSVTLEYYESGGQSEVELSYSGPAVPKQIIPQSQLYP
jgi:hypothetical protein